MLPYTYDAPEMLLYSLLKKYLNQGSRKLCPKSYDDLLIKMEPYSNCYNYNVVATFIKQHNKMLSGVSANINYLESKLDSLFLTEIF